MMQKTTAGLQLYYDPTETEAAAIIEAACERSVRLIQSRWGGALPQDCRVYVMTSWLRFLLLSAPWPWKVYLIATLPWIAIRARSIWPYSGGWSLSFGRRRVVGIKPPRLIQTGDRSMGDQIFTGDRDLSETVQTITCHELVHAFTSHLRLPPWLSEGLATLAMEYYLERRIVRMETLTMLASEQRGKIGTNRREELIALYARGYWLARYVDETRPELLKGLLAERQTKGELEDKLARAYGTDPDCFWEEVMEYFGASKTE